MEEIYYFLKALSEYMSDNIDTLHIVYQIKVSRVPLQICHFHLRIEDHFKLRVQSLLGLKVQC